MQNAVNVVDFIKRWAFNTRIFANLCGEVNQSLQPFYCIEKLDGFQKPKL